MPQSGRRDNGGGGGGGAPAPNPAAPPNLANIPKPPSAPNWWTPTQTTDPYAASSNALLPYLSPVDQQKVATMLGNNYASAFGSYLNTANVPGQNLTASAPGSNQYLSSGHASQALSTLNNMVRASGMNPANLGPGYSYLTSVLQTMQRLGGGADTSISRSGYQELQDSISNLQSQLKNQLTSTYAGVKKGAATVKGMNIPAWESLAGLLTNPSFSQGSVAPETIAKNGRTTYGTPNLRLFE